MLQSAKLVSPLTGEKVSHPQPGGFFWPIRPDCFHGWRPLCPIRFRDESAFPVWRGDRRIVSLQNPFGRLHAQFRPADAPARTPWAWMQKVFSFFQRNYFGKKPLGGAEGGGGGDETAASLPSILIPDLSSMYRSSPGSGRNSSWSFLASRT
jgi:hypothetical protein